jgi:RND family efflux transporter MFP subunit
MRSKRYLPGRAAMAGALTIVSVALGGTEPPGRPGPDEPAVAIGDDQAWSELAERLGAVKADTRAGKDTVMKFTIPTEVREILVNGGQRVKKGDVLVRARDADVLAALETQRFQASNETEVRSAEAQYELALFREEKGKATKNLSKSEEKELEIQVKVAGINVEAARSRLQTERLKLKYYEGQYERYRLEAPFDGQISEISVEIGQGVTDQQPALRIVNIDRLRIDAWPSTDLTLDLRLTEGSKAWVMLKGRPGWLEGRVMYVNPVADSVSQTRMVRVEVENPDQFPAGTPALVRFTAPSPAEGAGGGGRRASR